MMLQITEEQSINSTLMLCTQGVEKSLQIARWLKERKQAADTKIMKDICSVYRGGEVSAKSSADVQNLKNELNKLGGMNDEMPFFFHGNKSDLSYFWRIENGKNTILPTKELDTLDPKLKKDVIRAFTVAEHEGLLYNSGEAYAITEKGQKVIYDSEFVTRRLEADERFFKRATTAIEDICSMYRGGEISIKGSADVRNLKNELSKLGGMTKAKPFFFYGNKSDLSYFWRIENGKNTILPTKELNSLDPKLKKDVIRAFTVAEHEGLLYNSGEAYAITEKGQKLIYDPEFVARRFEAEERFFKRAATAIEDLEVPGLDGIKTNDTLYVFENGRTADTYKLEGVTVDNNGVMFLNLHSEQNGNLVLPSEAVGEIVFKDPTKGREYLDEHHEGIEKWQDLISDQRKASASELEPVIEEYTRKIEETEGSYLISVGQNDYEKLELPKTAVEKLEGGSIKATIVTDRDYNVYSGKEKYTVDGEGAHELLGKGREATANIGKKTATDVGKKASEAAAKATINAADAAATALPPAKAFTAAVKIIYKAAEITSQTAQSAAAVIKL